MDARPSLCACGGMLAGWLADFAGRGASETATEAAEAKAAAAAPTFVCIGGEHGRMRVQTEFDDDHADEAADNEDDDDVNVENDDDDDAATASARLPSEKRCRH